VNTRRFERDGLAVLECRANPLDPTGRPDANGQLSFRAAVRTALYVCFLFIPGAVRHVDAHAFTPAFKRVSMTFDRAWRDPGWIRFSLFSKLLPCKTGFGLLVAQAAVCAPRMITTSICCALFGVTLFKLSATLSHHRAIDGHDDSDQHVHRSGEVGIATAKKSNGD